MANTNITTQSCVFDETDTAALPWYALQAGSPAIDAGTTTGAPATDIEGTARGSTPDIGAYEKH